MQLLAVTRAADCEPRWVDAPSAAVDGALCSALARVIGHHYNRLRLSTEPALILTNARPALQCHRLLCTINKFVDPFIRFPECSEGEGVNDDLCYKITVNIL